MVRALLLILLSCAFGEGGLPKDCRASVGWVSDTCRNGFNPDCANRFTLAGKICGEASMEADHDFRDAKDLKDKVEARTRFEGILSDFKLVQRRFEEDTADFATLAFGKRRAEFDFIKEAIAKSEDRLEGMKEEISASSSGQGPAPVKDSSKADKKAGDRPEDKPPFKTDPKLQNAAGKALEDMSGGAGGEGPGMLKEAGRSYLQGQNPAEAERVLRLSAERKPGDAQTHALLATALAGQDRHAEAMESARKALSVDPEEPTARALLELLKRSVPESGRRWDMSRVSFAPGSDAGAVPSGTGGLPDGRAFVRGQAEPEAVAKAESTPARKALLQARRKLGLGDLEGALIEATRAVAAAPADPKALALRALVSNRLKNHKAALADADSALGLDPASVEALLERSYALLQLDDAEGALAAADAAVRLAPASALSRLYRAQALERLGRLAEALEDFQAAASLDPALEPLCASARRRLAGAGTPGRTLGSTAGSGRLALRLGAVGVSALLIMLGLTAAAAITRRRAAIPAREASFEPRGTVPPGTVLGSNYRVVREVGRGGMGVVYEAFDRALERTVAVKQLRSELCGRPGERELFLREARLVAKLKHPNIVDVHAVIDEGELYLVFDFVEGKTLAELLALQGRLGLPEAGGLVKASAAAVGWAHAKSIIHRDIKPSNIMVSRDGSVRVMDFGIARQSRDLSSPTLTSIAGTPQYMAPEQDFAPATRQSDLYSLGLVAYESVVGVFPFAGSDIRGRKLRGEFDSACGRVPTLPRGLDGFFSRALDPRPERRFPDAESFLEAWERSLTA